MIYKKADNMKRSKLFYQNFNVNGYKWAFWDEDLDAHCFTRKNEDGTFSTCYLWESDFDEIGQYKTDAKLSLENNLSRIGKHQLKRF